MGGCGSKNRRPDVLPTHEPCAPARTVPPPRPPRPDVTLASPLPSPPSPQRTVPIKQAEDACLGAVSNAKPDDAEPLCAQASSSDAPDPSLDMSEAGSASPLVEEEGALLQVVSQKGTAARLPFVLVLGLVSVLTLAALGLTTSMHPTQAPLPSPRPPLALPTVPPPPLPTPPVPVSSPPPLATRSPNGSPPPWTLSPPSPALPLVADRLNILLHSAAAERFLAAIASLSFAFSSAAVSALLLLVLAGRCLIRRRRKQQAAALLADLQAASRVAAFEDQLSEAKQLALRIDDSLEEAKALRMEQAAQATNSRSQREANGSARHARAKFKSRSQRAGGPPSHRADRDDAASAGRQSLLMV